MSGFLRLHLDVLPSDEVAAEAFAAAAPALSRAQRAARPFRDWREAYRLSYLGATGTFARRAEQAAGGREDRLPLDSRGPDARVSALEAGLGPDVFNDPAGVARRVHAALFADFDAIRPGAYRQVALNLGPSHASDLPYLTTCPPGAIDAALEDLAGELRRLVGSHPLKRIAVLYAGLIQIHPFEDGNGRTARTMLDAALVQGGCLERPIMSCEVALRSHDQENGHRLLRLFDRAEWPLLLHFLARSAGESAVAAERDLDAVVSRTFAGVR